MIWLLLRFVPIRAIIRIIAILSLIGGLLIAGGVTDVSAQANGTAGNQTTEANESTGVLFSHSPTVDLHSVEVKNGVAIVTMSSTTGGEQVVITDASRETSGEMERYRYVLEQGQNTFRFPLHNSDNPAVTVDSAGSIYLWVGDSSLNWTPDPGNAVPLVIGGGLIVLILIAGLHLVQTRGQTTAENPIR